MKDESKLDGRRGDRCRQLRRRLCAAGSATDPVPGLGGPLGAHLESCPECAAFAQRLAAARQALARPRLAPAAQGFDAGFAARVMAQISRIARSSPSGQKGWIDQPAEALLGWAAFRALPAALGLALVLVGFGFVLPAPTAAPRPAAELLAETSPSADQLMAWSAAPPEVWP
jgi:anti-sigma factor RsiW